MIHLIIPNSAVHFLRIRCTIPVNYMWNWGREEHSGVVVKHSQRFGWQTIEMEALKWNIKSVRFKIIHYLSSYPCNCCMGQESSNGMCMAGRLEIPMLWYTSFRALFRACEREAHIWAREGGELRWEELQRGLLSQRINTEQGMGEGSMPTIRCCGSNTQIPSPSR